VLKLVSTLCVVYIFLNVYTLVQKTDSSNEDTQWDTHILCYGVVYASLFSNNMFFLRLISQATRESGRAPTAEHRRAAGSLAGRPACPARSSRVAGRRQTASGCSTFRAPKFQLKQGNKQIYKFPRLNYTLRKKSNRKIWIFLVPSDTAIQFYSKYPR
jgi:hypothetical protein